MSLQINGSGVHTSTAMRVGVPPAADTKFSAGIIVQSEHVTYTDGTVVRQSTAVQ